ncbi:hypothetical protein D1822_09880 [Phaeobacter inhibens]|uniref:hypothetical protein n=1 Tax=Phaeobacter inhibens TaxID=221822 RepID=UPI0001633325|nr:hypothetical protein [Phaeobacter inhibens]AFO91730.1 hypothetical protein PGA1_c20450 [Phaeobacter inhibens DSM 17395]AUQ46396.1 hypothetical protein PhaeoP10_02064 [Phaeobacter inhibens]AXT23110.1 hypothetical protein D1822_09880 [Phaeobacter inhibens]
MQIAEHYLPDEIYEELVTALTSKMDFQDYPAVCPRSEVVTALGEIGNIWPASILDDVEVAAAA